MTTDNYIALARSTAPEQTALTMFIPDIDELKRKMASRFDFAAVTSSLLAKPTEAESDSDELTSGLGSLSRVECQRLVKKLEQHVYGPKKRKIAKAGHTIAITRHDPDRKTG